MIFLSIFIMYLEATFPSRTIVFKTETFEDEF